MEAVMPNVLTLFCHGTDYHRDKDPTKQEMITALSENIKGSEALIEKTGEPTPDNFFPYALRSKSANYLILEGPGSDTVASGSKKSITRSKTTHSHPGSDNPMFGGSKKSAASIKAPTGRKKGLFNRPVKADAFGSKANIRDEFGNITGTRKFTKEEKKFRESFVGNTDSPWQLSGRIYGSGWDDNVYRAVYLVTHLLGMGREPKYINIIGWSRGAVTCLKIANKLFEVFADTIYINIFAVDPVPGGKTTITPDITTIPPNVNAYLGVLALNDNRSNFDCLDREKLKILRPVRTPQFILTPKIHLLPMFGNHSDVVCAGKPSSADAALSGKLVLHLAWRFLTHFGTKFEEPFNSISTFNLPASALAAIYDHLLAQRKSIHAAASIKKGGIVSGSPRLRDVLVHREKYVSNKHRFVNEHHALCMQGGGSKPSRILPPPPEAGVVPPSREEDWAAWKLIGLQKQASLSSMGITC